jgi:putative membrane-bound dehydrogenase-like protein
MNFAVFNMIFSVKMSRRLLVALLLLAGGFPLLASPAFGADPIELAEIPTAWRRAKKAGTAWYRCDVKVPADWEGKQLKLFCEPVDDARQIYWNGKLITTLGKFPPQYQSGLGSAEYHDISADNVTVSGNNRLAIRVYVRAGRENFNVAAPTLFSPTEAIRLAGKWESVAGDEATWMTRPLTRDAAFSEVIAAAEARRILKRLPGEEGPLSIAESMKRFRVNDDLQLDVVLSEPHIGQPLSIKFDERGRMWIMQYRQYPNPAGLKAVSRDKYLRAVYDKVPPPPPNHFPGEDRISIHEDTDGDGRYDTHKTFLSGLSLATSMAIGRDGIWVMNSPYLLFYPDKNRDDKPDGPPEVRLQGFGIEDSHSVANNLRWGPDGWLYAAQGSTVTGQVVDPNVKDAKPVHSMGQLIWRYHPEKRKYEIFAEGGGNAFGVEIDAAGRIFSGHNGGDTRGFHYVQGGYYRKGFGKHGELSNPYTFGYFANMKHHKVPRFTHCFVIYEGGSLPANYNGRLFGVAPLQSHVVMSDVTGDGSTLQTKDLGYPLESKDPWFRPVDVQIGPDGSIYVADFYEQRIDHASHYQGRVHKDSGRIYRISGVSPTKNPSFDLWKSDVDHVADRLLNDSNRWVRQTALRVLADKRPQQLLPRLRKVLAEEEGQQALNALWAYHLIATENDTELLQWLDHKNPAVRSWVIRLVCDDGTISDETAQRLAKLARREENVRVRSQLACSARRVSTPQCLAVIENMLYRNADKSDPHLPLLHWWAIESKATTDADTVVKWMGKEEVWSKEFTQSDLAGKLVRRLALSGKRSDLILCAKLFSQADDQATQKNLMAGFEQAFQGRSAVGLPAEMVEQIDRLGGGSLALKIQRGDKAAISAAIGLIDDAKQKVALRTELVRLLGQIKSSEAVDPMLRILEKETESQLVIATITALQAFDNPVVAKALGERYSNFKGDAKETADTFFVSRPRFASQLLASIEEGKIDKNLVKGHVVQRMLLLHDKEVENRVKKIWGDQFHTDSAALRKRVAQLMVMLSEGQGDPYQGKALFAKSCGKCHALFDAGGDIGPNLTSYKRDDIQSMLLNVVDPSLEIREGYTNHAVYTLDGRVRSGFVVDRDNQVVIIRGQDGVRHVIETKEIDEMVPLKLSVMPERLLNGLSNQQIRDLFSYLRSTQPLP